MCVCAQGGERSQSLVRGGAIGQWRRWTAALASKETSMGGHARKGEHLKCAANWLAQCLRKWLQ